ncbi:proline-rich receptor-like protein kinase PERK2 [Benincasa hispida]|uniref:proline-rich receptor-like protein kinase PERK2 n=1 Tax=Benincasa hispida TaxID=102211 RepID=UPI0018FFB6F5|nr:proline-rich receptor-like protein kinase PERK2 [Benincasa hispida]
MSSASDSQNQTMSFENDSLVSFFSSFSVLTSPPPSPRKTSKPSVQIKPTHGGATSTSQRSSRSKPITTPTKPPLKSTKAITTLPAKTPQLKPKANPKPKPKTPSKPRQHLSSTTVNKPYTKAAPPPFIPNIAPVGATYDPLLTYLHNALSPAMRPAPPLLIQPLATIYPVELDASSQLSCSPIFILDEVMCSDQPNASLELDEAEWCTMMLETELEEEDGEEEERRIGPDASQSCQTDTNEGPS